MSAAAAHAPSAAHVDAKQGPTRPVCERARPEPASGVPAEGLSLFRCACGGGCPGCRGSTVHPKLAINTPGDAFEREADAAAEAVMSTAAAPASTTRAPAALRRCACGGSCPSCRQEKEEGELHREDAGAGSAPGFAPPEVHDVLASPGRPLAASTRGFMEGRFGADFSAVRVHDDARAAASARAVDAHAYAVGSDLVFGAGRYSPGTSAGDRLLAHELAHTLQQGGVARRLQRACGPAGIGAPAGCTPQAAAWLSNYPAYGFNVNCDSFAPGEQARMVTEAPALPPVVEVHGYASTDGDPAFNQSLSCARALKARDVLVAPAAAGGAALPPARIGGIVSHGPTPGATSARMSVVLSGPVPTPTPLPGVVPAPGATDFRIERQRSSTQQRIFFGRGSSAAADPDDVTAIGLIKAAAPGSVSLVGYASTDEPASLAQDRANAVRALLTAAPNPVTVTSATGNAPATVGRSDFSFARSVEVVLPGAAPATLDCTAVDGMGNLLHPPKQACSVMDPATETAFTAALPIANDAMSRAVASVAGAPNATDAPVIDRFFGNHDPGTLATLQANLAALQTHVANLPAITSCGGQCDKGGCDEGPIGYNSGGVDPTSRMTICVPTFRNTHVNDRARNLIHESAHGTSPLGGAPGTGTRDLAYRHERMMFQLAPVDRLRNSDSYALFAMFLREVQLTGVASAAPAGISTPAADTLTGFGSDEPALQLAIARLEKRMTWAEDWTGQLYGRVHKVRTDPRPWGAVGSWEHNLMTQAAARFPLNPPTAPSTTTLTDETRLAGILERYRRMKPVVKRSLTVTRMPTGVVSWSAAGGASWFASDTFSVGPDFFRASADDQVLLLQEALARATRDVEPAYVPAYVSFAQWVHAQNP